MLHLLQGIGNSLLTDITSSASYLPCGEGYGVNRTQFISSSGPLNLLVYLHNIFLFYMLAWLVPLFNSSLCSDETTSERGRRIALCKLSPALITFYLMPLLYFSSEYWHFIMYLYFYLFVVCLLHCYFSAMKVETFPSPLLYPKNLKYYLLIFRIICLVNEWNIQGI